jgi:hypothetical protein
MKMHIPVSATLRRAYSFQADEGSALSQVAPALRYFDVTTHGAATRLALAAYLDARRCARCRRILAESFERLGSTLFSDDDPRELARCFDGADACTVRLLAACIVLFGRPREGVH